MNIQVIKKPVITEKSLALANQKDTYVFQVDRLANRDQVAQAVKEAFGVDVLSVRTTVSHKKAIKTGKKRMAVITAPVKKAFVTIKKGQTIEVFDVSGVK